MHQPIKDKQAQPLYLNPLISGMITSVGFGAEHIAAAVRAGISNIRDSEIVNRDHQPMRLSQVPKAALKKMALSGHPFTDRQANMLHLINTALSQLFERLPEQNMPPLPIFLAAPEPLFNHDDPVDEPFLSRLFDEYKTRIDPTTSKVFSSGRAAGLIALHEAMDCMQAHALDHLILAGVDSYDQALLTSLDADGRVMADNVKEGFHPGEAAAALLLSRRPDESNERAVHIHRPGLADEEGHRYSQAPYRGDGLSTAVRQAFEQAPIQNTQSVWSTLNGERFAVKEWDVASIRNTQHFSYDFTTYHPAEHFGDIGAASAPVLLGLAAIGLMKGYVKGPSLIWCASETAARSAASMSMSMNMNNGDAEDAH